ncbi:MAG: acyltransferase [Lachnospiraceae bacterium]|nr:acyltransferase [Lachnospiraceae bacterium]
MLVFYILLILMIFWGAKFCKRGEWNEDYTSLKQTRILLGVQAFLIPLHHMAQKTCAPWHDPRYIVHGLDIFVPVGHLLVSVFLFCSGLGLYRSYKSKEDYLKGFVRKRILPLIIAFYLSEFIYLIVRALMGEEMGAKDVIWYLSGLHMANMNCWYIVAIIFFYFFFYLAFRFCKRDGTAIFWVFAASVLYAVFGAFVGHQDDWWMRGEWWYNSIILFPLGLLFARYEQRLTAVCKKAYPLLLPLSLIGTFAMYLISQLAMNVWWGYYGEYSHDPLTVPHRLLCCAVQWLLCAFYVAFHFLLLMKLKLGNRILAFLGGITLELYLMHGMFVEIFGYDFLEEVPSLYYIRNVPLYILVVLACSFPLTMLFHYLWKVLIRPLKEEKSSTALR